MEITRNTLDTSPGPADWFTGTVYIDTIAAPGQASTLGAAAVHFTPGARTAWHTHPLGQTIWVTEGIGPLPARGRRRRGHTARRPRLLRAGRKPLARCRTYTPDDAPRDAARRRQRQPCQLGSACQRRRVRTGANAPGRCSLMRGAVMYGPGDVRVEERDDPRIVDPADAIIRVSAACVCGSDLWPYRGIGVGGGAWPMPMGH